MIEHKHTIVVVADADASWEERSEMVQIIMAALEEKFPERCLRFYGSEDRELTLRNPTSY